MANGAGADLHGVCGAVVALSPSQRGRDGVFMVGVGIAHIALCSVGLGWVFCPLYREGTLFALYPYSLIRYVLGLLLLQGLAFWLPFLASCEYLKVRECLKLTSCGPFGVCGAMLVAVMLYHMTVLYSVRAWHVQN